MRRVLIAGNWKMNLDRAGSIELAASLLASWQETPAEVAICPPFIYLDAVSGVVRGTPLELGAQDCAATENGAFTGEVSVAMLADIGCRYVILGHSERRQLMGETDSQVNAKLARVIGAGLRPIVCVGETLDQREAGQTREVVLEQMEGSLAGIEAGTDFPLVIAYEPVWAIGTGRTATPEQAQEVHSDLRKWLADRYTRESADRIRILYGGSVKPGNAGELLAQADIDGALVGGASLKSDDFSAILAAAQTN